DAKEYAQGTNAAGLSSLYQSLVLASGSVENVLLLQAVAAAFSVIGCSLLGFRLGGLRGGLLSGLLMALSGPLVVFETKLLPTVFVMGGIVAVMLLLNVWQPSSLLGTAGLALGSAVMIQLWSAVLFSVVAIALFLAYATRSLSGWERLRHPLTF